MKLDIIVEADNIILQAVFSNKFLKLQEKEKISQQFETNILNIIF